MADAITGTRLSNRVIERDDGSRVLLAQEATCEGVAQYRKSEIDNSGDSTPIDVWKEPEEISSPGFLASLEGRTITLRHPASSVNPDNFAHVVRGHAQNVRTHKRTDGKVVVLFDAHIPDRAALDQIDHGGVRGWSLGYSYELAPGPTPDSYSQRNLRCNHISLVPEPRMGTMLCLDQKESEDMDTKMLERMCNLLEKILALNGVEISSEDSDIIATQPKAEKKPSLLGTALTSSPNGGAGNVNPVEDESGDLSAMISTLQNDSTMNVSQCRDALDGLRQIRGVVESSGDVGAILSFNQAMKNVKGQLGRLIEQPSRGTTFAYDSPPSDSAGAFENSVLRMRARLLGEPEPPERAEDYYRPCRSSLIAGDHRKDAEESYESQVLRMRERMLSGK
jgi:hypothetical protein